MFFKHADSLTNKRHGRRSIQPRKLLPYIGIVTTMTALITSFTGAFAAGPYDIQVPDKTQFAEETLDDGAIVQYIGDSNVSFGAAGTGLFDSFVRVQASPTEAGYNTDGTLQFDTKSGTWTHSILLSEIPTVEIGGELYWEFFADINDNNSTPQISLDTFELYLTSDSLLTGYPFVGTADKLYDWGDAAGDFILINDVNQGSGRGDLRYLVPLDAALTAIPADCDYGNPACATYLVLYTEWGSYDQTGFDGDSDGGFEEWKVKRYPTLLVSKDIIGTFDTPVDWTLTKVDNGAYSAFAGDSTADHAYTIDPEPVLGPAENTMVSGTITIVGDVKASSDDVDATDVNVMVTDLFNDAPVTITECSVDQNIDGTYTIAAGATVTCSYELDLDAPVNGTNVARATFTVDAITLAFQGLADIEVGDFTEIYTGYPEVNVTDDNGTPTTGDDNSFGPFTPTSHAAVGYSNSWTCPVDASLYVGDGVYEFSIINTASIDEIADREASATVDVTCYAPVVSKDASASYDERHTWDIEKAVDPGSQGAFAGDPVSWTWMVTLSESSVDENFAVSGTIDISNPAGSPGNMDVSLADALDDGTIATVDCGSGATSVTVAPGATESCSYSASPSDASATLNTTTASFNSLDFSATAPVSFVKTVINGTATVDDDQEPDLPLTLNAGEGPWSWTETVNNACSSDTAQYVGDGKYSFGDSNTATVTGSDGQTDIASASTSVICYAPVVSKNASASYDERHTWDVEKSVDPGSQGAFAGDPVSWTWTVTLSETSVDENFAVSGMINISNPAGSPGDMDVSLADALDDGTIATLDCGAGETSVTVAPGTMETCSYSAVPEDASATFNTAMASFNSIDFSATAPVSFVKTVINGTATVDDDQEPDLPLTLNASEGPWEWMETVNDACSSDTALYAGDGMYSFGDSNTATVTGSDGQTDTSSASTSVICYAPVVSKDVSASFGERHTWDIEKSVSPSSQNAFAGDPVSWTWTVTLSETSTDEGFAVSGTIDISNPAGSPGNMEVSLADALDDGTIATVDCGSGATSVTVAPGATKSCSYSASPSDASATLNTATASFNSIDFSATAPVSFVKTVINGTATVDDDQEPDFPLILNAGEGPWSWTETANNACSSDTAQYAGDGMYSFGDSNTATVTGSYGQTDSSSASTSVICYAPIVSKNANTSFTRTWTWTIEKSADQTELTLSPGQQFLVNYEVTVDATSTDSNWFVEGTITVENPHPDSAMSVDVSDSISGIGAVDVDCDPVEVGLQSSLTVQPSDSATCAYSASLSDGSSRTNTATATLNTIDFEATADVTFGDPTEEIDEEINLSDTNPEFAAAFGPDVVVNAYDAPETFEYSAYVGPFEAPGECFDQLAINTASFVAGSGATGAAVWTINVYVPCDFGCTLTPGYWKTHSQFGPAPYDEIWAQIGEDTLFFLSGQSYYEVLWTPPKGGNAYYILAHAYIAAELNQLNGASFDAVQAAFDEATVLFETYTPDEVANMKGQDGKETRDQFVSLAEILDDYNNGLIGPGHCSE